MVRCVYLSFLLILIVPLCSGLRIVVSIGGSIKSLSDLMAQIGHVLAEGGHDVTLMTSYPPKYSHKMTVVNFPELAGTWDNVNIFELMEIENVTRQFNKVIDYILPRFWNSEKAMDLWKKRLTYDMFIMTSYFGEGIFPMLMDSNAQLVQVITPGIEALSLSRSGNWMSPAVVSSILVNFDDEMTFWERVQNLPAFITYYPLTDSFTKRIGDQMLSIFPNLGDVFSYYDRVELSLINGHFALDGIVPLLPNQISIGTINIKKPKPLPQDLQEFMDASGEAGVIYFSLGSIAKSGNIPSFAKKAFVEAFKRVPQRVIWKYDGVDVSLPPNVMARSWLPQQDILNHPKTRVFISHCGNQGTQEAKYFGVPVLGVPIAFDQPRNAMRMQRKRQALVLNWNEISADKLVETLNKLVNDSTYKEHIGQVSRLLQDQKESPAERTLWWVEYIARHKKSPQLVYAGKNLYLWQYIMLDVIAFWLSLLAVLIFVVVFIFKRLCCSKNKNKTAKQKTS